jgi:hypothetical protein
VIGNTIIVKLRITEKSLEVSKDKVLKIRNHKHGTYEIIDLQDAGHVVMQKFKRRRSLRDGFAYSTLIIFSLSVLAFIIATMYPILYLVGFGLLILSFLKHRYLDGKQTAKLIIQWKSSSKKHVVDLRDLPEEDVEYLFDLISSRF